MLTRIKLDLDHRGLQTLKMALGALSLNAQALEVDLDHQVAQQLAASEVQPPADPPPPDAPSANGNGKKPLNGHANKDGG